MKMPTFPETYDLEVLEDLHLEFYTRNFPTVTYLSLNKEDSPEHDIYGDLERSERSYDVYSINVGPVSFVEPAVNIGLFTEEVEIDQVFYLSRVQSENKGIEPSPGDVIVWGDKYFEVGTVKPDTDSHFAISDVFFDYKLFCFIPDSEPNVSLDSGMVEVHVGSESQFGYFEEQGQTVYVLDDIEVTLIHHDGDTLHVTSDSEEFQHYLEDGIGSDVSVLVGSEDLQTYIFEGIGTDVAVSTGSEDLKFTTFPYSPASQTDVDFSLDREAFLVGDKVAVDFYIGHSGEVVSVSVGGDDSL